MAGTTTQPTLLSAARNFIRKSTGTAAMIIAPLAAISVAPEAKGQTIFTTPTVTTSQAGTAQMAASFPPENTFSIQEGTTNSITAMRLGTMGTFTTGSTISGFGTSASNALRFFTPITNSAISANTFLPLAYEFTLTKQSGIVGNVTWSLDAQLAGESTATLGSGILSSASATYTGSNTFHIVNPILGDGSVNFEFHLYLNYTTATSDVLAVAMNSGSQGYTLNAVPEPSTYAALLGLGALGFSFVRRLRRAGTA